MPFGRRDSDAGADWGPEEDDLVRRALQSLREDVDASVLPGPKAARDEGNRRRRARWTVAGFGLAAAGVAIAAVGLSGVLRPGHSLTDPATGASRSVTSGPATSGPATSGPATGADVGAGVPDWGVVESSGEFVPPLGERGDLHLPGHGRGLGRPSRRTRDPPHRRRVAGGAHPEHPPVGGRRAGRSG
ncbi:MAG: hypothetical protein IPH03_10080 [Tetrasphaera sp.]|nr:hypothetical protein [Tetrasphaera sp.]